VVDLRAGGQFSTGDKGSVFSRRRHRLLTGFDWVAELDRLVTDVNSQIVVAELIRNYFLPDLEDGEPHSISPGSLAFYRAWARAA
jgi:hypothetical protein